jgi:nucleoside-diphosphate-sugar epimerase
MNQADSVVIFGGTGFIGTHLAQHLLREQRARKIALVDLAPPRVEPWTTLLQERLGTGQVNFIPGDVRRPIQNPSLPAHADLIVNLAAIHREPGHKPAEYFETNLYGAENVCAWAAATGCPRVVFASSIAPYGSSEESKDEHSLPVPDSPYGGSKLAAEKIHLAWQSARPERRLLILRPGVVFGPGENGNVTRLVRSLVKGYFVYMGNRQTRKAGGYVKELCRVVDFGLERLDGAEEGVALLNFGMNPTPALEDFVDSIRRVAGIRRSPASIPRSLLFGAAWPIDVVARTFGISQPVNPVRLRKLIRSTYIDSRGLRELGYTWKYSLDDAFRDWQQDLPADFSQ